MTKTIVDPRYGEGWSPLTKILKDGDHYEIVGAAAPKANVLIKFQTGPVKEVGLNGTFVEDLLVIVRDRLEGYQAGLFPDLFNVKALNAVQSALDSLSARTADRVFRGVEGTGTA